MNTYDIFAQNKVRYLGTIALWEMKKEIFARNSSLQEMPGSPK